MENDYQKMLEQRDALQNRINVLQNRLDQKQNSEKTKQRKKRTRQLIQKGALLEKYFKLENASIEDTERILLMFSDYVKSNMPSFVIDGNKSETPE